MSMEPDNRSIEQMIEMCHTVGEAVRAAGARVVDTGEEVGVRAIRQAQENAREFAGALRAMGELDSAADMVELYARYIREAAQRRTEQLIEIGEVIADAKLFPWANPKDNAPDSR